uniref:F-box domain-containing protein n=1 Tax=Anopheles atroparvus TaxID=41427 RepID=A0AAG5DL65_ANOAO
MASISDLPNEILDHIFSFLKMDDKKHAQLVCHGWNQRFLSPRFWKTLTLQLDPSRLKKTGADALLQAAGQGRYNCIDILERIPVGRNAQVVELLEACQFSLVELRLVECNAGTLRTVFGTLGKMCRLRYLTVETTNNARLPKVLPAVSGAVGLANVTHLDVCLNNVSCLNLVRRLATQLKCLALTVTEKRDLLVRCLNEHHLTALESLTVDAMDCFVPILPEELGDRCWRTMAQLDTLKYTSRKVCIVLTEIIRNCKNLKELAIDNCTVSFECIEQICALQGLKDLTLNLYEMFDGIDMDPPPLLEIPNVENLYLSPEISLRLGKRWPKLTSIAFNTPSAFASERAKRLLSDITKIEGIHERRLRKFLLKAVDLDREAIEWLQTLPIDLLTFEECRIDGSVLDVFTGSETRKNIWRIVMEECTLLFSNEMAYNVRTFEALRAKCPHLRIVNINVTLKDCDELY